jgi:hypothetical protein
LSVIRSPSTIIKKGTGSQDDHGGDVKKAPLTTKSRFWQIVGAG